MKVDKSRLHQIDASKWAKRPQLFVDAFGGWDAVEYMGWVSYNSMQYLDKLSKERGYRVAAIMDQDDFTRFLADTVKAGTGRHAM